MSKENKPFKLDKKKVLALLILFLTITLVIGIYKESRVESIPIAKNKTQFALASWVFPDEYGQGIDRIFVQENSTGFWVDIGVASYPDGRNNVLDWNVSVGIKLRVYTRLNETLTGATDVVDGENYQRHNVTVTCAGQTIFSQNNFTLYDSGNYGADISFYEYHVVLNFLPQDGQIYMVTVTYEVFY